MMSVDDAVIGANPDELAALSRIFLKSAESLKQTRSLLSRSLVALPWAGPGADAFIDQWNRSHRRSLDAVAAVLIDQAERLAREANEQRETSSADSLTSICRVEVDLPDPSPKKTHHILGLEYGDGPHSEETSLPLIDDSGIDVQDVMQGQLGDCYLMAALAALAASPSGQDWLRSRITDNHNGTYTVHFSDQDVTVDDDFYSDKGGPVYGHGPNDTWVAVIEEAYAKKYGNFRGIEGGYPRDVLAELGVPGANSGDTSELTGDELSRILASGHPVTMSADLEKWGRHGRHAFSVVEVVPLTDFGLPEDHVRLRNPWGSNNGLTLEGVKLNDDGTFTIPLSRARELFYEIDWAELP